MTTQQVKMRGFSRWRQPAVLVLLSLGFAAGALQAAAELSLPGKTLVVPHIADAPPFMLTDQQQLPTGGLLYELYQQLSTQTGYALEIVPIPRKRVIEQLLAGQLDLYCNASPDWFSDPALRFSPPLFSNRDLYVSTSQFTSAADFSAHAAGPVGTTFGYIYPTLTAMLASGQLQRVDSYSPAESVRHLLKGHLSAVVISEFEYYHLLQGRTEFNVFAVAKNDVHCLYAPTLADAQVERLNQILMQLEKRGVIEQILQKFRSNAATPIPALY